MCFLQEPLIVTLTVRARVCVCVCVSVCLSIYLSVCLSGRNGRVVTTQPTAYLQSMMFCRAPARLRCLKPPRLPVPTRVPLCTRAGRSPYTVLELPNDATDEQVQTAYRTLAKR